jgi:serine/threonine-protein kinase
MINHDDSGPIALRTGFKAGDSIGAYKLVRKLGSGGMGTVYEACHEELGRRCAIKILKDELSTNAKIVKRFFNEARAVAKIHHENIIDVYDFGQTNDGRYFFIMELLEGVSLQSELKQRGTLEVKRACFIIGQVARALAASHTAGIVHRDLKPANLILIRRANVNDFVKVLDFGVAKLIQKSDADDTETGMVIGTTRYMSPEQCRGGKQVDHRADIYALNMVFYHMLAGKLPFDADNPGDMMVQHLTAKPPALSTLLPGLPPEIDALVARSLEKDPAERPQRMDDFADALVPFGAPARPPDAPVNEPASPSTFDLDSDETPPFGPLTPVSEIKRSSPSPATSVERRRSRIRGRSKLWPVVAFGLAVSVIGAGVGFWRGAERRHPSTTQVARSSAAPSPPPAAPETVKVVIVSTPPGASVFVGSETSPAGPTPIELKMKRDSAPVRLRLTKDGFQPLEQQVVPAAEQHLNLMLSPVAVAAPAPKATSKPKSRASRPAGGNKPPEGLLAPSY